MALVPVLVGTLTAALAKALAALVKALVVATAAAAAPAQALAQAQVAAQVAAASALAQAVTQAAVQEAAVALQAAWPARQAVQNVAVAHKSTMLSSLVSGRTVRAIGPKNPLGLSGNARLLEAKEPQRRRCAAGRILAEPRARKGMSLVLAGSSCRERR